MLLQLEQATLNVDDVPDNIIVSGCQICGVLYILMCREKVLKHSLKFVV